MKRYSAEWKAAVLKKMLPPMNLSVAEVSRQEGISDVTLYAWRRTVKAEGVPVPGAGKVPDTWSAEAKLAVVIETAEVAMAHELLDLTWKKLRLMQLEQRVLYDQVYEPPKASPFDDELLFQEKVVRNFHRLISIDPSESGVILGQYLDAKALLAKKEITAEDFESLATKRASLYRYLQDSAKEFGIAQLTIDTPEMDEGDNPLAGAEHTSFIKACLIEIVEEYDDIFRLLSDVPQIHREWRELKDRRLMNFMQNQNVSRARDDLSRQFFRVLAELRKHQDWRRERNALVIDAEPANQPLDDDVPHAA